MSAVSSISSGPSERFSVRVGALAVAGVLHLPPSPPAPCVVACHGLGASKDSDKYLLLGRMMPEAGLALARFDFRGAGESRGSYPDATLATRVADPHAGGGEPRALHWIRGADHRLTDMGHRMDAVERSRGWMTKHLREGEPR